MNAPIAAAVHEILALTRIYRELERARLIDAGAELERVKHDFAQLRKGTKPMATPAPAAQLAAMVKSARAGHLRSVTARALGSIGEGADAFDDLSAALGQYEDAVDNAKALAAFVRHELQAENSNGAPAGAEKVVLTAKDVGNVVDVLGNSSASSQASSDPPAPAAAAVAAGAVAVGPIPPPPVAQAGSSAPTPYSRAAPPPPPPTTRSPPSSSSNTTLTG